MTALHGAPAGQTLGALVHQLSQQIPELIRSAAPERAIQGIKDDIATVKGTRHE